MTTTSDARPATRPGLPVLALRGVFALYGAAKLAGTAYFTFFASAAEGGEPSGVVDWLVVGWSTALAVSFLVLAVRLTADDPRPIRVTVGVLVADIAFSLVKLTAYDEPEAVGFITVDLLLLALLAIAVRAGRRGDS